MQIDKDIWCEKLCYFDFNFSCSLGIHMLSALFTWSIDQFVLQIFFVCCCCVNITNCPIAKPVIAATRLSLSFMKKLAVHTYGGCGHKSTKESGSYHWIEYLSTRNSKNALVFIFNLLNIAGYLFDAVELIRTVYCSLLSFTWVCSLSISLFVFPLRSYFFFREGLYLDPMQDHFS